MPIGTATTASTALRTIEAATRPVDLFPASEDAGAIFRRLAKSCHPDTHKGARAEAAFKKLSEFYAIVTRGKNGKTEDAASVASLPTIGKWSILASLAHGSIADTYQVRGDLGIGFLKIARQERDNDLLAREARSLQALAKADSEIIASATVDATSAGTPGGSRFSRYLPRLLDTFKADGRRANVTAFHADLLSLESIVRTHTTQGRRLDFRHVVWMGNRIWEILGFVHREGLIHGAILQHHLLYRPSDHGLVLIDWTCSVPYPSDDGHIPLVVKRWAAMYPPEVAKKGCYCSTDLYMAMRCLEYAAGGPTAIPRAFRPLFELCTAGSPSSRPVDAWEVQDRWKATAKSLYGEPKFVVLDVPTN